jgi:hypothetical protein
MSLRDVLIAMCGTETVDITVSAWWPVWVSSDCWLSCHAVDVQSYCVAWRQSRCCFLCYVTHWSDKWSPLLRWNILPPFLKYTCPCINSIITNDYQKNATILDLFISILLCMFLAIPSHIIRSTLLYLQLRLLSTNIAAGWYHGWYHPLYKLTAILVDNTRSCKCSYVLLMMGEGIDLNM